MSLYTVSTFKDSNEKRELSNSSIGIYLPMRFAHNVNRLESDTPINPKFLTVSWLSSSVSINEAAV